MPNPGDEHAAGDVPEEALGPDDLRRLADLLERPTKYGATTAREGMRDCASVWEADRETIEGLRRKRQLDGARIEALEKALRANMEWIGAPPTDRHSYDSKREEAWAIGVAALAAEEEPHA
jgi:hypothetical protein